MHKKAGRVYFFGLLFAVVFVALYSPIGPPINLSLPSLLEGRFVSALDQYIGKNLPFQKQLAEISLSLGLLSGQQEQNQIFISADGLIRNIDEPSMVIIDNNISAVREFAQHVGKPTYLMLIPTASAILQQQLPPYAQLNNNQKPLMEYIYGKMAGVVTTVDVYPALFNKRDEYIYYRTEDNLTALGGYYVFNSLIGKLGRDTRDPVGLRQYDISYLSHEYYGNLYKSSPYRPVRPDVLTAFHYTYYDRKYTVTHIQGDHAKTYHTLYPTHLLDLGDPIQVYLGGISAITDIRIASPNNVRKLLVFGDKTALSYLPFVVDTYAQVTLVDLFLLGEYSAIQPDQYDQVLFAYSTENFNSHFPRLATRLLENLPSDEPDILQEFADTPPAGNTDAAVPRSSPKNSL